MLWIFLLFAWFWLVITIFIDIFRSDDLGGFAKAMWLLFVLFLERSAAGPELRSAVLVGFLGAFTTFSTFSIETLNLIEQADYLKAVLNMLISVLACVAAAWIGLVIGRQL